MKPVVAAPSSGAIERPSKAASSPARGAIALDIAGLSKTYASGFQALKNIHLAIHRGEIFALLGPNGAGKSTLIGIVCGLVTASTGSVRVCDHDVAAQWRAARRLIGLVPQELTTDAFETVLTTVRYSRGLFGKPPDDGLVEDILRKLTLWERRHDKILMLSGGMKRRVMIAKALSHEPEVLFLDEPSAGVDVELRRDMWNLVRSLKDSGVTVILTTHYIEEAEEIADRIGVIDRGEIVLVEEKAALMRKLGDKVLTLHLSMAIDAIPTPLRDLPLALAADGRELTYSYNRQRGGHNVQRLLTELSAAGIHYDDIRTEQTSLEDIFVRLVRERR